MSIESTERKIPFENLHVGEKITSAINKMLAAKLAKFAHRPVDRMTCMQIYSEIFSGIKEIVETIPSLGKITNDGLNFVSQCYYEMVTITSSAGTFIELDPNIFDKYVNPNDLPNVELVLCASLLYKTPFYVEVAKILKSRS
jgi:hypothetical protein